MYSIRLAPQDVWLDKSSYLLGKSWVDWTRKEDIYLASTLEEAKTFLVEVYKSLGGNTLLEKRIPRVRLYKLTENEEREMIIFKLRGY